MLQRNVTRVRRWRIRAIAARGARVRLIALRSLGEHNMIVLVSNRILAIANLTGRAITNCYPRIASMTIVRSCRLETGLKSNANG